MCYLVLVKSSCAWIHSIGYIPDKPFHNFRASKSVFRRSRTIKNSSIHGFWGSKIVKGFVGYLSRVEGLNIIHGFNHAIFRSTPFTDTGVDRIVLSPDTLRGSDPPIPWFCALSVKFPLANNSWLTCRKIWETDRQLVGTNGRLQIPSWLSFGNFAGD